jgi:hypothetical protein
VLAIRGLVAAGSLALLALLPACGGGEEADRPTGPVAALYVIDHLGADPAPDGLEPYEKAFARVRSGCRITADDLANQVLRLADQASKGSGRTITNLQVLRAIGSHVGGTRTDCTDLFVTVEARLEGGSLG